ncbi:hypothetical protein [Streptomyces sp. NPDC052701]|uniref:hypothetical protein n=1 Tax=Streptomyces sp. NPDC052701 TaxID=3155533 RepID=UPI00342BC9FD
MRFFGPDVLALADRLTEAYAGVFTAPPWEHRNVEETRAAFRARLETDARRPGFRAVPALSDRGEVNGFATGWTTRAPFRTGRAYGKVMRCLGADRVNDLLVGAFEVDELGVRSHARGTGLGRRLLSALTATAGGAAEAVPPGSDLGDEPLEQEIRFGRCRGKGPRRPACTTPWFPPGHGPQPE